MMEEKIIFMSYNGLRKKKLDELPKNFFDDALVVIDEVHNVIRSVINGSRIMNQFYEMLLNARRSKFVLLSATPIINKPFEISYIVNLLHGYVNVLTISYTVKDKMSLVELKKVLDKIPYIDFYDIYPTTGKIDIKLAPDGYITNVSKGKGIEFLKLNKD
jgi:superfamily II DNA or RNA helicase